MICARDRDLRAATRETVYTGRDAVVSASKQYHVAFFNPCSDDQFRRSAAPLRKLLGIGYALFILAGCATRSTVDADGRVIVHNFGYVKIVKPPAFPAKKDINVTGARLIGFSVGEGLTLGYKDTEFISVPIDCRVLVVVKNDAQLAHLIKDLDLIEKDEICATTSPKP